jgi:hypothetical protein
LCISGTITLQCWELAKQKKNTTFVTLKIPAHTMHISNNIQKVQMVYRC